MDDREPRDVMLQALSNCGCFNVDVQHLPVGDYLIDDALLIERKTLPDLLRDTNVSDARLHGVPPIPGRESGKAHGADARSAKPLSYRRGRRSG